MRDGQAIGVISLALKDPGGFSDSQIEMLKTFAEQAVIAISSAEMYRALQTRTADLQESLEYQTATSDVLKVISRSTFDLQPVLEKLLSIAIRLCNADDANLSQREADGLRVLATRSALAEWAAALEGRLLPEDRSSVTGRAVLARRPVQIADAAEDADYTLSGAVAVGHSRTCLGVPLLRDGVVIGATA
jgi:GAF domain-containing protein